MPKFVIKPGQFYYFCRIRCFGQFNAHLFCHSQADRTAFFVMLAFCRRGAQPEQDEKYKDIS